MWLFGFICGAVVSGAGVWYGKDKLQSFWTSTETLIANLEAKLAALKAKVGG